MIPHLARLLSDETSIWLRQRNGVSPNNGRITPMPPFIEGAVPMALQFTHSFTDDTTGKRHDISVHIAETVSGP